MIAAEPLAELDYVSVADAETLDELAVVRSAPRSPAYAVRFGGTRLADERQLLHADR